MLRFFIYTLLFHFSSFPNSTRRFVLCLTLCHFVLVFCSPFSIAITSLWEEKANLSTFRMFVRFVLVWVCRFPLPLGVWEGLRFVIVALPGLFSCKTQAILLKLFTFTTIPRILKCGINVGYDSLYRGKESWPALHILPFISGLPPSGKH